MWTHLIEEKTEIALKNSHLCEKATYAFLRVKIL
jgi:hypothetical protein